MSYQFYAPVKIFLGSLHENVNEFFGYGKKAFVVTGKSSSRNGALNDVKAILSQLKIGYCIYDQVQVNPPIESVIMCAKEGIQQGVDFVIAVGGGSAIDTAKAVSVLIAFQSDNALLLDSGSENRHVPLLAVPTTAGTGSESTASAILTNHLLKTKTSMKRRVFCAKAFIDPKYTYDLPKDITRSTSVDVLSHLIDGYLSAQATVITDRLAESGFRHFAKQVNNLGAGNFTQEFRDEIYVASIIGGIVIANTRTTLPHLMSYPLTYAKGVAHGFSCGLLTGEFLHFHEDKKRIERLLSCCCFASLDELSGFLKSLCPEVRCSMSDIHAFSDIVFADKNRLSMHPYPVEYRDIVNIYERSISAPCGEKVEVF